jgi:hypothetical protein
VTCSDYYLTTIAKNLGSLARQGFRGFFFKMAEICAISTKPLRRRAFRLDGLITPTLKAAGSNPVGRTNTKKDTQKRVFFRVGTVLQRKTGRLRAGD